MIDLTTVSYEDCTADQLYSLLFAYDYRIKLQPNIAYKYTYVIPGIASEENPFPADITKTVVFTPVNEELYLNPRNLETLIPSENYTQFNFNHKMKEWREFNGTHTLLLPEETTDTVTFTAGITEFITEASYNYLTAFSMSDLDFALSLYCRLGEKYSYPELTEANKDYILSLIIDNKELAKDKEHTVMLAAINRVGLALEKMFDPDFDVTVEPNYY